LTGEIDDLERRALRDHLRTCTTPNPVELGRETDEVLRHFRLAGDL
jgi:hypothetical protein